MLARRKEIIDPLTARCLKTLPTDAFAGATAFPEIAARWGELLFNLSLNQQSIRLQWSLPNDAIHLPGTPVKGGNSFPCSIIPDHQLMETVFPFHNTEEANQQATFVRLGKTERYRRKKEKSCRTIAEETSLPCCP